MPRVEFHSHTIYSKDSLTTPEKLLSACRRKKLDRIIVTDHNTIAGALRARELDPERVIIGEEIMTTQGELLAAFVNDEIPAGLHPLEAIEKLRDQGAFISVSHPFDRWRKGHWDPEDLLAITPLVDAIETFNARCILPTFNEEAAEFALQNDLAGTVGSDAHAVMEIGKACMVLPDFKDATGLKAVIHRGEPYTDLSPPWIHFTSRYAVWYKKLFLKGPVRT